MFAACCNAQVTIAYVLRAGGSLDLKRVLRGFMAVAFSPLFAAFFGLRPCGRRVPVAPTPGVIPGVGPLNLVQVGASAGTDTWGR